MTEGIFLCESFVGRKIADAGVANELISENGDVFGASAEYATRIALLTDNDRIVLNRKLGVRSDVKPISVAKLLWDNESSVSVYLSVYSCFFHNFLRKTLFHVI